MAKSPLATLKYFSTLLVCALALAAGWWLWNYYMQGPWTRDGKVRAELVSITPEVSGKIIKIAVKDNQLVKTGELVFTLDPAPYRIALDNASAALAKAKSDLDKAEHEATRRRGLSNNVISAEAGDEARLNAQAMKAAYQVAQANLEQAQWSLAKTQVHAASDGYITNLQTRVGNYASAGVPLVALVDIHSFYVQGYFEETKLRRIAPGKPAEVVLYSGDQTLRGEVESIGRAIHDQSVDGGSSLLLDVKPNVPWVRLAQRVPVRIRLLDVPPELALIAGTTCTITIGE
ncbi:efflux transporter periplasmic adaptor subunit [Aeromonas piscicola]|uniref:efflux RND transporter periplasmic adaptor subunit n=1 Tax=Aeromonas piscicola TaxID=600645 RepID=UPI0005B32627|nr:HlyD family secretion protein [Aeromonas piscicola]OCA64758.1 efflux transporter periplasmic adaptor subunit [Aeromonas piscicola]